MSERNPQHSVTDAAEHYRERMAAFARERVTPGGIVLLGSSHFEWFDTDCFLPNLPIVNRGIASDRLGIGERGILRRLDVSVFDCQPSRIVFNNGVNDLGELWRTGAPPMSKICDAYTRVIETIRDRLPAVPVVIVNELPAAGRFAGLNPLVPPLNEHIARVAESTGCTHIDFLADVVNPAGELRADLTWDGLHLNDAGYTLLAERLLRVL